MWQSRVIATEAHTNNVGIARSVEERLFNLSLSIDRLAAGKSEPFKQFCQQALQLNDALPPIPPMLSPEGRNDFQRVTAILNERLQLQRSLQRQKRARLIIRSWRAVHIPLSILAVLVISYHAFYELYMIYILHQ